MNKLITLLSASVLGISLSASAQIVLQENFNGTSGTALPAGWSQVTKATTGWKTNTGSLAFTAGWAVPAGTGRYAVVDEWNNNEDNDTTRLVTPIINLTGISGAYLTYNSYFVKATYSSGSPTEDAYIYASTDGGTTWSVIDTVNADPTDWKLNAVSLNAYNNIPNLKLAFTYHDGKGGTANKLIGFAVDDVKVFVPSANDITVQSLTLPVLTATQNAAGNGTSVKFDVLNVSPAVVTSIEAQYTIDGGAPVTQTFTGLSIAQFASSTLTFTTTLSGISSGPHTIVVTGLKVNTVVDPNPSDNVVTGNFLGVSNQVQRNCLIEEFTSSTCAPCASFNSTFDPFIASINVNNQSSNFNIIKYQMNWPSPGNDASYNAHGNVRRGYYGVSGIPDHYTNGMPGAGGDQAEVDDCKGGSAFVDITGTYYTSNDSIWAHVDVKPFFNLSQNLVVRVAVVENDYYNSKATTSQLHYIHVMRMMLPDAAGSTVSNWVDNTSQVYDFKKKVTVGNVTQNSYNLWTHPKNTNLVIFVQDDASKQILQSKVIPAQWPTGINNVAGGVNNLAVYPNPAAQQTTAGFNMNTAGGATISVTDALGRVVYTSSKNLPAGFNEVTIPTSSLAKGVYVVKVQTDKGAETQRLTIAD